MFQGKPVVWITGASSGIGEELAKVYSKEGYFVILSARREAKLKEVVSELYAPDSSLVLPMDVTQSVSIAQAWDLVSSQSIEVDLLINNAGISQRSKILDTTLETYRKLMEVNYHGVVDLTKRVVEDMVARKEGHIAVISSIAGKVGAPKRSGYSASKHALHGFFDCLRAEVTDDGVNVTIVCPGYARTNIDVNALNADGQASKTRDNENQTGLFPDKLAQDIFKAIQRKKKEVYFGGFEVVAVYLKRFFPGLLSRILVKKNRTT